jgi:hypothetical protein
MAAEAAKTPHIDPREIRDESIATRFNTASPFAFESCMVTWASAGVSPLESNPNTTIGSPFSKK